MRGRWNRLGLQAIYASFDVTTATYEAYQRIVRLGFPMSTIQPRVTASASMSLAAVLDMCNEKVQAKLGFLLSKLVEENWGAIQSGGDESWTQAIGCGSCQTG